MQSDFVSQSERLRKWLVPILSSLIIAGGAIITAKHTSDLSSRKPVQIIPDTSRASQPSPGIRGAAPNPISNLAESKGIYLVNLLFSLLFLITWIVGGKTRQELNFFYRTWLLFWAGLCGFYLHRMFWHDAIAGKNPLHVLLDESLSNLNTIFVFLSYIALLYPKNMDFSGRREAINRFTVGTFSVVIILFALAFLFPQTGEVSPTKLLSALFAGVAFCFLGARLESLLSQRYFFTSVVFIYSSVQILYAFEFINTVFSFVYLAAFLGKALLGLLVLNYYPQIAANAVCFYDIKRAQISSGSASGEQLAMD
jgi:hypothetical protein